MNIELVEAIRALEKERGIDAELLFTAVEEALVSACKREMGDKNRSIYAEIDRETGEISLDAHKIIVETVQDPGAEITIEDAYAVTQDDSLSIGDIVSFSVSHDRMGRLAAQTAKSIINQKLQQAEKERIQSEYQEKIGEIVQGIVQSSDRRETVVDIGRAEAVLLKREQSRLDSYDFGRRMKFLISGVSERRGRPVVYVSRSQAGLVAKLFCNEVPELGNGPIEIKSVVREAGSRTKMAVYSHDPDIDAVGSCVGQGGMRVQQVINELNGEKIDIIEWNEDPAIFVRNALSPAKVIRVNISRVEEASCRVIVADNQLSLAIGKEGQNARLAAKLTKWKIDIKSESQYREILEQGLKAHLAREEAEAHEAMDAMYAMAAMGSMGAEEAMVHSGVSGKAGADGAMSPSGVQAVLGGAAAADPELYDLTALKIDGNSAFAESKPIIHDPNDSFSMPSMQQLPASRAAEELESEAELGDTGADADVTGLSEMFSEEDVPEGLAKVFADADDEDAEEQETEAKADPEAE